MRRLLRKLFILLILVVMAGGVAAYFGATRLSESYKGYPDAETFVEIPVGAGAAAIGQRLADAGVVQDAVTFRAAIWVSGRARELKAEKDRMLAKMASAQARVRIQDQLEGLSVDAEVKALETVREHIKDTIAHAKLGTELKESDLDTRLQQLRTQTGDATSKAEWERLRGAAAAKAASQKKTM